MSKTKFERMDEFFDVRASTYDEHMKNNVKSFDGLYSLVSSPIEETEKEIEILDLGIGTGLELKKIFEKAPNARITGIDLSEKMLEFLQHKYCNKIDQIEVRQGSYMTLPFEEEKYDYVVSVMSVHHFLHEDKVNLYIKILKALKNGGIYIEGDYVVDLEKEEKYLNEYFRIKKENKLSVEDLYHIDIPFSLQTQEELFYRAGFKNFDLIFKKDEAAIYTGEK